MVKADVKIGDNGGLRTVREATQYLRLSRSKIHELMSTGQLSFCKFGRARRIPQLSLEQYVRRCLVEA
jgi:excisionase family DNA binding protein